MLTLNLTTPILAIGVRSSHWSVTNLMCPPRNSVLSQIYYRTRCQLWSSVSFLPFILFLTFILGGHQRTTCRVRFSPTMQAPGIKLDSEHAYPLSHQTSPEFFLLAGPVMLGKASLPPTFNEFVTTSLGSRKPATFVPTIL